MLTPAPAASVRRVLVVYKTSPWERYTDLGLLGTAPALVEGAAGGPSVADRLLSAHELHLRSAERVHRVLAASGLDVTVSTSPTKRQAERADLVMSVGGDGTFLASAMQVRDTPMLGVNSAPGRSVGHYCATSADGFAALLAAVLEGTAPLTSLTRIAVTIGERRLAHDALNDVLVAHRVPAAATRCLLRVGGQEEVQISSGVWFSTASGASGAIRSAGGRAMPPTDPRIQYLVREPYPRLDVPAALTHGLVDADPDRELELTARSPHLSVWLDGQHRGHRIELGDRVRVRRSEVPLRVFGYRPSGP